MTTTLYPPPPRAIIPSLYVHLPFCRSRCAYCAFVSSVYQPEIVEKYLDALETEIALRSGAFLGEKPTTVFIGGGTPSSLNPKQLERLLSIVPILDGSEATCEINPDSINNEKLTLLRQAGISRCSFGVQTFSADGLHLLGRRHDANTAKKAIRRAGEMGFSSVNIDLITAWPGQDENIVRADLAQALELGVTHVSCYNLILEEESRFYQVMAKRGLQEKGDDEVRCLWDITEDVLKQAGFEHYEISNFARPGFRCRHNVDIWKGKEYIGVGAAAHSHSRGRRFANTPDIKKYMKKLEKGEVAEAFSEQLEFEAKARECAVFWLRLTEGIDSREFRERTGYDIFSLYHKELPGLVEKGIVEIAPPMLRIGKQYHPVLDAVLVDLV